MTTGGRGEAVPDAKQALWNAKDQEPWMDDDHPIRFAEAYPFPRPASCFLFRDGGIHSLPAGWRDGDRAPVVAIGANAAPRRLAQKFMAPGEAIPVTRARLHDHAVVFSAHYSSYGALPATVWQASGATTEVFVTWLDPGQLERMHRSEGVGRRYRVVALDGVELRTPGHEGIERAEAYVSEAGALAPAGAPIRLAELRRSVTGASHQTGAYGSDRGLSIPPEHSPDTARRPTTTPRPRQPSIAQVEFASLNLPCRV